MMGAIEKLRLAIMCPDVRKRKPQGEAERLLDAIDRHILRTLQQDSSIANQALADAVGLSPPACLKRVRQLKVLGIIERTTAQLSAEALGYPLLTVARIKLNRPTEKSMRDFEKRMSTLTRVVQCLTVAGDIDYVVLIRSRDVTHYQEFARRILATAPAVRSYTSEIVLAINKWTTEVPVD